MQGVTTIKVRRDTSDLLGRLRGIGESKDDVVRRLLTHAGHLASSAEA